MFRIERIHEAIFVLSLAWCFGIAIISNYMGLFYETGAFIAVKPWLFKRSFIWSGEENTFSKETGVRLGQLSEFSLLVAILAFNLGHITKAASQFIQLVTILTFIVSSYIVTLSYPTPIGPSKQLKKD